MSEPHSATSSRPQVLPYLRLLRIPNVFTAIADILMGVIVVQGRLEPLPLVLCLVASSGLLYLAGMVLNDVFDVEQDTRERAFRPIPAGQVSLGTARSLGWSLLAAGTLAGISASLLAGQPWPALIAVILAVCVWGYDRVFKRTPLGPLAMGACRGLNVLLGMSIAPELIRAAPQGVIAGGMFVYIAGVTWLGRTEALRSRRWQLLAASLVVLAGVTLLASYPWWTESLSIPKRWNLFWGVMIASIGWRCAWAVVDPAPGSVQAAVKHCILSIIVLDAAVAYGASGPSQAIGIVLLLVPTLLLGRWVYST